MNLLAAKFILAGSSAARKGSAGLGSSLGLDFGFPKSLKPPPRTGEPPPVFAAPKLGAEAKRLLSSEAAGPGAEVSSCQAAVSSSWRIGQDLARLKCNWHPPDKALS